MPTREGSGRESRPGAASAESIAHARVGPVLVADLGASSFRAALFAPDGEALRIASRPRRLAAEEDARSWLAALESLVAELLGDERLAPIEAVAITAFTRSEVLLDASGMPLRPALTFLDTRAAEDAVRLNAVPGMAGVFTSVHPLARLAWFERHEPATRAKVAHVLQPKDFLNFHLAGVLASDSPSNVPLVGETRDYQLVRFAAAGVDASLFAPLCSPRHRLGRVRAGLPGSLARLEGASVVVGAMDTWAATLGLGVHAPGLAYNLAGTTEVNGLMLAAPARAEGLLGVAWDDGLFHLGGPSQAGAGCLAWLASLFATTPEMLARAAEAIDPAAAVPIFLPYLDGERVPFWNASLRGGFLDLVRDSDPPLLARAVMEAIAFHDRLVLERASAGARARPREVVLGGGGNASDLWCRIKADCWSLPLHRPAVAEPGLRGAFLLATGHETPPPDGPRLAADARASAALESRYRRFLDAVDRMMNRGRSPA